MSCNRVGNIEKMTGETCPTNEANPPQSADFTNHLTTKEIFFLGDIYDVEDESIACILTVNEKKETCQVPVVQTESADFLGDLQIKEEGGNLQPLVVHGTEQEACESTSKDSLQNPTFIVKTAAPVSERPALVGPCVWDNDPLFLINREPLERDDSPSISKDESSINCIKLNESKSTECSDSSSEGEMYEERGVSNVDTETLSQEEEHLTFATPKASTSTRFESLEIETPQSSTKQTNRRSLYRGMAMLLCTTPLVFLWTSRGGSSRASSSS